MKSMNRCLVDKILRYSILAVTVLVFAACTTTHKDLRATEALFNTDKSTTVLLEDLKKAMEAKSFKVAKMDVTTGRLQTEERQFSFPYSGAAKLKAWQLIHVHQEGGSVKIRISYTCERPNNYGESQKEKCNSLDKKFRAKQKMIEKTTFDVIQSVLLKYKGSDEDETEESNVETSTSDPESL
jgi:hypothetical protein